MPELPEVETVVRQLRPQLVGRTIERAHVLWRRSVGGGRSFERQVRGRKVERLDRRAKYVLFRLDQGALVGHLRMSGRMHVRRPGFQPGRHTRVCLHLAGGDVFEFLDVRKFGRLLYAKCAEDVLPPLGPEPLDDAFTRTWFRGALRDRRRRVKPLLLDQSFVAGLGNIYVDESLHTARVHPLQPAKSVSARKADVLHAAIREVLGQAIRRQGSSFDAAYRTPDDQPGTFQHEFKVYGREGQPCRTCGARIRKTMVAQRGTHVCPRCQRTPSA